MEKKAAASAAIHDGGHFELCISAHSLQLLAVVAAAAATMIPND